MSYTHNRGYSATESGFAVGVKDHEIPIFTGTSLATAGYNIGTLSSTVSGVGRTLSSSSPVVNSFCMDDATATLGNEVYIGTRNRIMLFKDQAGVSIFGTRGQIKLADTVDLATGVYAANQGYIEMRGHSHVQSGAKVWGYDSCIEIPSGYVFDVDSGGVAAGLHAEITGAGTLSTTGVMAGLYIDSSASTAVWPKGIYIKAGGTAIPFQLGEWASATSTGHVLTATNNYAVQLNCDDGNAAITDSISTPLFSRYLLIRGQTSGATQAGLYAQLKTYGSLTFDKGGIRGAYIFNQAGTITLATNAEYVTINAASTLAGTMTVASGCTFAGIDVNLAGAGEVSVSSGGTSAGIIIRAKSAEAARWPVGLLIPTGSVQIGASYVPGSAIMIGDSTSSPMTTTYTGTTNMVSVYSKLNAASGVLRGIVSQVEFSGTCAGGTVNSYAIRGYSKMSGTANTDAYCIGVQGKVEMSGTLQDGGKIAALQAQINSSSGTFTSGQISGLWVSSQLTSGQVSGMSTAARTGFDMIKVENAGACNAMIFFYGGADYLFQLSDTGGAAWVDAVANCATPSGKIKILVGNTAKYIQLYNA